MGISKVNLFFAKNRRFNDFFHLLPPNRGERGKNSLFGPRQTPSAKIGHVGIYFAKRAVKSSMDSRIFSGSNRGILSLVRVSFCSALITPGAQINFAAKREKWLSPFSRRSHLFFSLILTLL